MTNKLCSEVDQCKLKANIVSTHKIEHFEHCQHCVLIAYFAADGLDV
jgi:hypothetical protein